MAKTKQFTNLLYALPTFNELSPRPYRVFIKNFVNTLFYLYQLIQTQKHLLLKIKSQHIDIF